MKGFQITKFPIAEFYLPHKPVIRKKAGSTKLQVVYDASAKYETGFSLNECLEKGRPLQNNLWDVLVRSRFHPIIFCAYIEKALLGFIGLKLLIMIKLLGLVFGLTQSPFILEGTLDVHFDNCGQEFRKVVEKVRDDMYVD